MSVVFYFANDVSDNVYLNKILSNKNYDPQRPLCKKKKKNNKKLYTFPFTIFTRFCSKHDFLHSEVYFFF